MGRTGGKSLRQNKLLVFEEKGPLCVCVGGGGVEALTRRGGGGGGESGGEMEGVGGGEGGALGGGGGGGGLEALTRREMRLGRLKGPDPIGSCAC